MAESKLNDIIKTSLESIRTMIDANTIIGEPINTTNDTVIIPVSKVSLGYASGGVDYASKNANQNADKLNFGGGGGTGITVNPIGFLVIDKEGKVELLSISNSATQDPTSSAIATLIDRSPDIVNKIKSIFSKKEDKSEEQ